MSPVVRGAALPFGAVRARGWLGRQLRLQADGLTGRLEDVWDDVGPHSAWRGGDGEAWERGPYYTRGLVALAHALGDATLHARAAPWLAWTLASQREDGFFGPAANDDWWARMPMVDALRFHHESTGDARVLPFLQRWCRHQLATLPARPLAAWAPMRGADAVEQALWTHARTGDARLLDVAALLAAQTSDWTAELAGDAPSTDFPLGHGVNRAMGLREPAMRARRTGDAGALAALARGWETTMRRHGQPSGVFSCDEFLHGRGATQGAELCTVVELLSSLRTALETGAGAWAADALERIAYNALPAAFAPDLCTRQYLQQPNQVLCTPGARSFSVPHGDDLLFGVATGYGCCTANAHLGWPLVVRALWIATDDGGLCAPCYAPSSLHTTVAGVPVVVDEETDWPFGERVAFHLRPATPIAFPLVLRVPTWATSATLSVNGEAVAAVPGFVRLERTWRAGDVVELACDAAVRLVPEPEGGVHLARGPLVFVVPVGEDWRAVRGTPPFADHELHPTTPWAYALAGNAAATDVERAPLAQQPWTTMTAPLRLRADAYALPGWTMHDGSAAPVPAATGAPSTARERLVLVPYGAARLRVTCLPHLGD